MSEEKAVVEYKSREGDVVKLSPNMIIKYLVKGRPELVTEAETIHFLMHCKARQLNPFTKDCYLLKYDQSPAAIITSVDHYRRNAREAPDCQGWRCGIIILKKGGMIENREGSFKLPDEELVGAWFEATPKGWSSPFIHTINLAPYIKCKRDGSPTQFWQPEKQPDMIVKVVEAQGLRKLWGEKSTGTYIPEEMPTPESVTPEQFAQVPTPASDKKSEVNQKLDALFERQGVKKPAPDVVKLQKEIPDPQPEEHLAPEKPSNPFDRREDWIKFRSSTNSLSSYYYRHRDFWYDAKDDIRAEFIAKWERFYTEDPPKMWPEDEVKAPPLPAHTAAGPISPEGPEDPDLPEPEDTESESVPPDDEERSDMWGMILAENHPEDIENAQRKLGFVVGTQNCPPTLDGVIALKDELY